MPITRVVGAGRAVLYTWATLVAKSSKRRKEKTQSDLRIGLIVASYFLAPFHLEIGVATPSLAGISPTSKMKSATNCIALAVILSCFFSARATSQRRQPDIHSADRIATGSERLPSVAWTSSA